MLLKVVKPSPGLWCGAPLGHLHFLELQQAFERTGGLQHREVIVVEAPTRRKEEEKHS